MIRGRSDDMFKVRGVNMFPSQIEDLLQNVDGVASEYTVTLAHDDEKNRVATTYMNYRLHDIVHSFYVAFKAYHEIAAYASTHGIHIYNATPDSFIDAFERRPL